DVQSAKQNKGADFTSAKNVFNIILPPSCGVFASQATCPAGQEDPGVFTLSNTGTATDAAECGGNTNFTISAPIAPDGHVTITPGFSLRGGGLTTTSAPIAASATTVDVVSTSSFTTSGSATLKDSTGTNVVGFLIWTGKNATQFTGTVPFSFVGFPLPTGTQVVQDPGSCTINFNIVSVDATPTKDASPSL